VSDSIDSKLELGDLEVDIFKMCNIDRPFLVKMMTHLKAEYFSSDTLKILFKIYKRTFDEFDGKTPSRKIIENLLSKTSARFNKEIMNEYLNQIFQEDPLINISERDYITKQVVSFAKHARMIEAVTESYRLLGEEADNDNEVVFEQVVGLVRDALMFNVDVQIGYDLFDIDARYKNLREAHLNKITTGFNQIDEVLEGGWSRKELYCFMGPPGIGKCHVYDAEIEIEIDDDDPYFNKIKHLLFDINQ